MNLQLKLNIHIKYKVYLIISLIFALLFSHTFFSSFFAKSLKSTETVITATGDKNKKSGGSDIRIVRILLDGEELSFDSIQKDGDWLHADGVWMVVNPDQPCRLTFSANDVKNLQIDFQRHDGSGIVEVAVNGKRLRRIDLYSPRWDTYHFQREIGPVSVLNNPVAFVCVLIVVMFSLQGLLKLYENMKKNGFVRRNIKILIAVYAILVLFSIMYHTEKLGLQCGVVMMFVAASGSTINAWVRREKEKRDYRIFAEGIWLLMAAVVTYYLMELVDQNLGNVKFIYACGNAAVYFLILLLAYMLIRRVSYTVFVVMIAMYFFVVANSFVSSFRGSPIVPGDFFSAGTAKNVFLNYHYNLTGTMLLALWMVAAFCLLTFYFYGKEKSNKSRVLVWTFPSAMLLGFFMGSAFFAPDMNFWNQKLNIQQYGIAVSFISNLRHMRMDPPEGYSSKNSEEMISEFVESDNADSGVRPNVIAIMNESFSDLSVIFPELDNETYMSNFNSLQGNVVKGYMQVYPIGGGTANTEYEFLTGNSMAFLQGAVPYQQYITRNATYSIAQILKARDYHTVAIHPYDKTGYSRYRVYPRLGFDEFLDVSDFENAELIRDRYISDRDSYEKVIEEFEKIEETGKPAFIFNVTMQNHSGYDTGYFGEDVVQIPEHEGEFPNAEEYLTLIRKSDAALPVLIDYFGQVEEPTVIVFFGDHQPMVEESFYETLSGKSLSEWTLAEAQSRYIVPFFIWANYEIEAEDNVFTSANYLSELLFEKAGMKLIPYQEFLKSLREEIPAMDGSAWRDKDGNWEVLDKEQPILQEYWRLQYRNMFDKKIHY